MDNPASESSVLDINSASSAFASVLFPDPPAEEKKDEPAEAPAVEAAEPEAPAEPESTDDGSITFEVDGKPVTLTKEQLAENYKSGLRQADYTRKTMEAAETRKAAQTEADKAKTERAEYSTKLQQAKTHLEAALQLQQQNTDWEKLLQSDPVEYLKQRHHADTWQAQLKQVMTEQQSLQSQAQAEANEARRTHIETQQQELLAKLPEWKDEAKAKADKAALREYLLTSGYEREAVDNISNARDVEIAVKAMRYDDLMRKANAAAKKVATLPSKVVQPGNGAPQALDKRTSAFQKLSKSGKAEDAAGLLASLL